MLAKIVIAVYSRKLLRESLVCFQVTLRVCVKETLTATREGTLIERQNGRFYDISASGFSVIGRSSSICFEASKTSTGKRAIDNTNFDLKIRGLVDWSELD
jgi:hypothetical protein